MDTVHYLMGGDTPFIHVYIAFVWAIGAFVAGFYLGLKADR